MTTTLINSRQGNKAVSKHAVASAGEMKRPVWMGKAVSFSIVALSLLQLWCYIPTAHSFSPPSTSTSSATLTSQHQRSQTMAPLYAYKKFGNKESQNKTSKDSKDSIALSRRRALTKAATVAATAAATLTSNANAAKASITVEPTKIELNVETDYLIRALETFDGDMRKVLAAIVRSPMTTVHIEAPNSKKGEARDAILRALYSYEVPEDYVEQASWLDLQAKDNSIVGWLTKKRYKLTIPNISAPNVASMPQNKYAFTEGAEQPLKKLPVENPPQVERPERKFKDTITLSNLEAGVAAGVLSYPATYAYYNYEGYQADQEAKAKRAKLAAKKKAAAAKKKKAVAKKGGAAAGGDKKKAVVMKKDKPVVKKKKAAPKQPKPATVVAAADTTGAAGKAKTAPNGDREALWRKLEAQVAQSKTQQPAKEVAPTEPAVSVPVAATPSVEVTPAPVEPEPLPVVASPVPATASTTQSSGGMSAYDAYLKQAYEAAATSEQSPPTPASEAAGQQTAPSYSSIPPPQVPLPQTPAPKVPVSAFGSYLDTL